MPPHNLMVGLGLNGFLNTSELVGCSALQKDAVLFLSLHYFQLNCRDAISGAERGAGGGSSLWPRTPRFVLSKRSSKHTVQEQGSKSHEH